MKDLDEDIYAKLLALEKEIKTLKEFLHYEGAENCSRAGELEHIHCHRGYIWKT